MSNCDFGLIKYSSYNIGDDIQSIAAKRFLPKIDHYIQRERTKQFRNNRKTKLIMNAWWMWDIESFPPSQDIDPLLISMYLRKEIREKLVRGPVRDYFIENGPVGCRDTSTAEFLNSIGIPAYFSGCLTLTLEPNKDIKKEDFILLVDVPSEVAEYIEKTSNKPVLNITRMLSPYFDSLSRLEIAQLTLQLYQSASCVVSPCLHVVLPCLAIDTKVMRLDIGEHTGIQKSTGDAQGRFSGMENLAHTVSKDRVLAGDFKYDFDNPPENPDDYLAIKEKLVEKCEKFTGYSSKEPQFGEKFPLIKLFQLLQENKDMVKKAPYFTGRKNLIKNIIGRTFKGLSRFDSEV